jgi:5-methylthioribose kinase
MLLSAENIIDLENYLKTKNWLEKSEKVMKVEKPGEGNMNFTLRVYISSNKTFIIKQSRAYVEKYPTIPAPANRAIIEGEFYKFTQQNKILSTSMPAILGIDEANNIIITQDLGLSNDFTNLYKPNEVISPTEIEAIATFLSKLHRSFYSEMPNPIFTNREMRALNHEHIFVYPFLAENGFNLDTILEGLQEEALIYKNDIVLKEKIKVLGNVYLADGNYLLHGDYYFGSFLRTNDGVKIIDPEFCFYGFAEFDLGVLIANLKMSNQSQDTIDRVLNFYQKPKDFNSNLLNQFIGIEIMRRIIGLAQLPISLTLQQRIDLLKEAKLLIINN